MEILTLDIARKIMAQQHLSIAALRDVSLRHGSLHHAASDALSKSGSSTEADYRKLYEKAFEGFKLEDMFHPKLETAAK